MFEHIWFSDSYLAHILVASLDRLDLVLNTKLDGLNFAFDRLTGFPRELLRTSHKQVLDIEKLSRVS